MRILVADDELSLRKALENILTKHGHEVSFAVNGLEACRMAAEQWPDLMILDVMMPEMNGFDVCEHLRQAGSRVPIILLSAKGDIVDKSIGFKMGADDYIVKPFDPQELMLRVNAQLRRSGYDGSVAVSREKTDRAAAGAVPVGGGKKSAAGSVFAVGHCGQAGGSGTTFGGVRQAVGAVSGAKEASGANAGRSAASRLKDEVKSEIMVGDLKIYLDRYEVYKRGKKVNLTPKEFEVLALLASSPGVVYTREEILAFLWNGENDKDINSVTVFVRRIREKIEDNSSKPQYILTVWMVGYKFCSEED